MKPRAGMFRRLAVPVLGGLALFIMWRWFEHHQVYHPSRALDATGAELGRPFEEANFRSRDGVELHGWFFPPAGAAPGAARVLLFCHGNAGNITHRLDTCDAMLETGAAVFVFDYRGYGRSRGRPSEEGTYLDAQAAHAWLRARGFSPSHILAFGESLGGAVACELVLREPCGGLILQSTFTSIPDIGAELFPWLPVRRLARIRYDTQAKLPRVKVPVLVMHSRADDLVGFAHAEKNFAAANPPKLFCELSGDHNNPLADRARFIGGLRQFFQLIESNPAAAAPGASPEASGPKQP